MKRPALNNRLEEEVSDCFSTSAPNSSQANQEGNISPYLSNNYGISDTDSLSDASGKNRKKRQTYQKISDEIRLHLLDAVKNGETLKSAAKRYKINYSSAKSILHTYRKEGRILKKSAQERSSIRKKNSIAISTVSSESHMPRKMVKRESNKPIGSYSTVGQSIASIPEEMKPESASGDSRKGSNDMMTGFFNGVHNHGQMTFTEEGVHVDYAPQPKLFENFHFNNNSNFMENNNMFNNTFNNMQQFQNFPMFSNDNGNGNGSYNDMDHNRWLSKSSIHEEIGDPSAFLYNGMKGGDERTGRFENEMFPEYNRNYMDAPHLFKEALKNNDAYANRKSSIDFF